MDVLEKLTTDSERRITKRCELLLNACHDRSLVCMNSLLVVIRR